MSDRVNRRVGKELDVGGCHRGVSPCYELRIVLRVTDPDRLFFFFFFSIRHPRRALPNLIGLE